MIELGRHHRSPIPVPGCSPKLIFHSLDGCCAQRQASLLLEKYALDNPYSEFGDYDPRLQIRSLLVVAEACALCALLVRFAKAQIMPDGEFVVFYSFKDELLSTSASRRWLS